MNYSQWISALNKEFNKPINILDISVANYPTINFKAIYRAGYSPQGAYELVGAIINFLKKGCVI